MGIKPKINKMVKKLTSTLFILILIVIVLTVLVLYNILPEWLLFTITIFYMIKNVLNDNKDKKNH